MHLTLFLTHSLSLRTWYEQGIFDREVAIYRHLQAKGVDINIVSYGGRDEFDFLSQIPEMRILCNWVGWSEKRYSNRLHQLHGWRLWQSDVYKTNQLNGAQIAVKASKVWKRPLVLRFGYLWSAFAEKSHDANSQWIDHIHRIQDEAFKHAEHIIMTSALMLNDIQATVLNIEDKVTLIPNYVDTELFKPMDIQKQYDLVFVGRVSQQKNLEALLKALRGTDYILAIVGDGDLSDDLQSQFNDLREQIYWLGRVPHQELPELINQGRVFILPSHYEGHPKSLIEAMACGVPVIGTRVRGIRQVITHQENGYLCEPNADSIRQAIEDVLSKPKLMENIGQRAHQFAQEYYSLDHIAQMEYNLLKQVVGQK